MGAKTNIAWTDATWNPATGCDPVSSGCDNCYAQTLAERFRGTPGNYYEQGFDVVLRPDKLEEPLRWTKPRRVFVNSMSDLFHDSIPDEYIVKVFAIMALAQRHTFQLLTKRHGRMRSLLSNQQYAQTPSGWISFEDAVKNVAFNSRNNYLSSKQFKDLPNPDDLAWPLPNLWLGVSVEDQKWANVRIPALLDAPAAVRFLSMEPLLGPVDLELALSRRTLGLELGDCLDCAQPLDLHDPGGYNIGAECTVPLVGVRPIDWVIVGGESGHGARPMHPDWARSLRDQCTAAGVPFVFKQWGEWAPHRLDGGVHVNHKLSASRDQYEGVRFAADGTVYRGDQPDLYSYPGMASMLRVGKRKAGDLLDGVAWVEFPDEHPSTDPNTDPIPTSTLQES